MWGYVHGRREPKFSFPLDSEHCAKDLKALPSAPQIVFNFLLPMCGAQRESFC